MMTTLTQEFSERKDVSGMQPASGYVIGWKENQLLRWVLEHADEIERALFEYEEKRAK